MYLTNILNNLNFTPFTNITFYLLLIIIISNSIAALLHFYSPRNTKILIALSVPKTVTITYIIINALCQLEKSSILYSYFKLSY